jgi:hypothetical protein
VEIFQEYMEHRSPEEREACKPTCTLFSGHMHNSALTEINLNPRSVTGRLGISALNLHEISIPRKVHMSRFIVPSSL